MATCDESIAIVSSVPLAGVSVMLPSPAKMSSLNVKTIFWSTTNIPLSVDTLLTNVGGVVSGISPSGGFVPAASSSVAGELQV